LREPSEQRPTPPPCSWPPQHTQTLQAPPLTSSPVPLCPTPRPPGTYALTNQEKDGEICTEGQLDPLPRGPLPTMGLLQLPVGAEFSEGGGSPRERVRSKYFM
jgi:hypothetical protein